MVDKKPVVLVMAGHDPSGGAGIQADIETIARNNCHAATVITALTTQNTSEFIKSISVNPDDFQEQINLILAEMQIKSCKIGLIADLGILSIIEKTLYSLKNIPIVIDPVINAGSGEKMMTDDITVSLYEKLMPFTTVITPNSIEARKLTGMDSLEAAAAEFHKRGCTAVLITGTHEQTEKVVNTLFLKNETPLSNEWDRLPGNYHGSGCTLASAIAAQLALGRDIKQSVSTAQEYTWQTLKHGVLLGKTQIHPDRFYK